MHAIPINELQAPFCIAETRGVGEFICWTRMQSEAGQPLDAIIARKELERCAGGGLFSWGVGNAPAVAVKALARLRHPVQAIFSIMKGKPRSEDVQPRRTVAWRRYLDAEGVLRVLPPHMLITSRADSARGPKDRHFALMCWSDTPLAIQRGVPFDPSAYRNASGTGGSVGASQVTALLTPTSTPSDMTQYEVNLRAWLIDGYWVRLADPIELNAHAIRAVAEGPSRGVDWVDLVTDIRRPAVASRHEGFEDRTLI